MSEINENNLSGSIANNDNAVFSLDPHSEEERNTARIKLKEYLMLKKKVKKIKKMLKEDGEGGGGGAAVGGASSGISGNIARVGTVLPFNMSRQESEHTKQSEDVEKYLGSRIKLKKKKKKVMKESTDEEEDISIDNFLNGDVGPKNADSEDTDSRQDREVDQQLRGEKVKSKPAKTAPVKPIKFDKTLKDSQTNKGAPDTVDSAEIDILNASYDPEYKGYKLIVESEEEGSEHNMDDYENTYGPDGVAIKFPLVDIKVLKIGEEEVEDEPFEIEKVESEETENSEEEVESEGEETATETDLKIEALQAQIDELKKKIGSAMNDEYPREDVGDEHFKKDIAAGFDVKKTEDGKFQVIGKSTSYEYITTPKETIATDWVKKLKDAEKNPGAVKQDLQSAKENPKSAPQIAQSKTPEQKAETLNSSFSKMRTNNKFLIASTKLLLNKVEKINERLQDTKLQAKVLLESEKEYKKLTIEKPHKLIAKFLKEKKIKFVKDINSYLKLFKESYVTFYKNGTVSDATIKTLEENINTLSKTFHPLAYFLEAAFLIDQRSSEEVDDIANTLDSNKTIIAKIKDESEEKEGENLNPLKKSCPTCGSEAIGMDKQQSDDSCAWCVNGHKWNIKTCQICGEVEIPTDYRNLIYKDGKFVDKDDVVGDNEQAISEEEIKNSEEKESKKQQPLPITDLDSKNTIEVTPMEKEKPELKPEEVKSEEVKSEEVKSESEETPKVNSEEVNSEEIESEEEPKVTESEEDTEVNSESEEVNSESEEKVKKSK